MRAAALLLGLFAACADDTAERQQRVAEARALVARLDEPEAFARVVALGEVAPLLEATEANRPERMRKLACLALGRIGGDAARDRLLALLAAPTPDPLVQGALRLYAAAGLTILKDPGTAVDLVNQLSTVNPNDNVAALAGEGVESDYYTVDAQICDALLAMGLWSAEDELVAQLRRRDKVRVLIDAHAALVRHTGIDLPFRYNGGLPDREADALAWAKRLKETRKERMRARPFDSSNPRFQARSRDMIVWLGGQAVNERYVAEKVLVRLGPVAVPFLAEALVKGGPSGQREAALVLGRIGDLAAAPALRQALGLADGKARARALDALRLIGDKDAVAPAALRLKDADPEVRANAAALLGVLGDASHKDPLREQLAKETAPATMTQLAIALSRLGDTGQTPRLLSIFMDGEQLDRQAAYDELHRLAPEWKADPLAPREERAAAARRYPGK